jgi:putative ABC transport system permease protein
MDVLMHLDLAPDKFIAILIAAFGALALVLSALGTYGMLNNAVQQRLKEMGIRMALGATPGSVLGLVLRQGLKLASLGGVIGLICAFAATRLISSLLFGVSSSDIASYLAAWLVMTFVAGLACYLPARRATRVDPLVALRYE